MKECIFEKQKYSASFRQQIFDNSEPTMDCIKEKSKYYNWKPSCLQGATTFNRMTFNRMTFNRMTLNKMTLNRMTSSRKTLNRMTLNRMTLNRMTLNRMTFIQKH